MLFARSLTILATLLAAPTAMAAADLSTSMSVNISPQLTYSTARYTVNVANIGNKNASNCTVSIALPQTHTAPQVYVLGILGAKSASCTQTGTTLNCTLGTINKFASRSVFFDIALPVSTTPFVFTATAATTSAENTLANNTATRTAAERYEFNTVNAAPGAPQVHTARHCTGTGLTSFYECSLFPSSIMAHQHELNADGTVTIPGEPAYTGGWSLTTVPGVGNFLEFYYEEIGVGVVVEFEGWGADRGANNNCFEGLATFPGSSYVSPYEVCP